MMGTTTRPDKDIYDRHGWHEDYMDLLAHGLRAPSPIKAARGVADYRRILTWEMEHLERDKQAPHTITEVVQESIDGITAAIWGLHALEEALTSRVVVRHELSAPAPMGAIGARQSLRALEAIASLPGDLHVRAQAAREWVDALQEALPVEGSRGPLGQDPPTEGPRDAVMGYLDWPVCMANSTEAL